MYKNFFRIFWRTGCGYGADSKEKDDFIGLMCYNVRKTRERRKNNDV